MEVKEREHYIKNMIKMRL